ncbi:MAG: SDR family NAD(P)-dependent oxidoreductase [Acidobacteria bacterium]|nr:SDR family NAD(P)-dependent oxidoreductase [Acidobacteriota bacterium]
MASEPRFAVITGATSGFGRATALHLATEGYDVCLVGRSPERGADVTAEINRISSVKTYVVSGDLSSIGDVARVGDEIASLERPINLLVNNAGAIFGLRRAESNDGIEMTMALNHFAYVQLTRRLLDLVIAAAPSKIINVASDAYSFAKGRFDFEDWQATRRYRPHRQYGMSKLANILFTKELARRVAESNISVVAWSPKGLTATRFAYGSNRLAPLAMKLTHPFVTKTQDAVVSLLDLCDRQPTPDEQGAFFHDTRIDPVDVATDDDAKRLWDLSEQILDEKSGRQ